MSTVDDIERAVQALPLDDLVKFRSWFYRFEAEIWDAEFERDAEAGRLDEVAEVAEAALREHHRGETRQL